MSARARIDRRSISAPVKSALINTHSFTDSTEWGTQLGDNDRTSTNSASDVGDGNVNSKEPVQIPWGLQKIVKVEGADEGDLVYNHTHTDVCADQRRISPLSRKAFKGSVLEGNDQFREEFEENISPCAPPYPCNVEDGTVMGDIPPIVSLACMEVGDSALTNVPDQLFQGLSSMSLGSVDRPASIVDKYKRNEEKISWPTRKYSRVMPPIEQHISQDRQQFGSSEVSNEVLRDEIDESPEGTAVGRKRQNSEVFPKPLRSCSGSSECSQIHARVPEHLGRRASTKPHAHMRTQSDEYVSDGETIRDFGRLSGEAADISRTLSPNEPSYSTFAVLSPEKASLSVEVNDDKTESVRPADDISNVATSDANVGSLNLDFKRHALQTRQSSLPQTLPSFPRSVRSPSRFEPPDNAKALTRSSLDFRDSGWNVSIPLQIASADYDMQPSTTHNAVSAIISFTLEKAMIEAQSLLRSMNIDIQMGEIAIQRVAENTTPFSISAPLSKKVSIATLSAQSQQHVVPDALSSSEKHHRNESFRASSSTKNLLASTASSSIHDAVKRVAPHLSPSDSPRSSSGFGKASLSEQPVASYPSKVPGTIRDVPSRSLSSTHTTEEDNITAISNHSATTSSSSSIVNVLSPPLEYETQQLKRLRTGSDECTPAHPIQHSVLQPLVHTHQEQSILNHTQPPYSDSTPSSLLSDAQFANERTHSEAQGVDPSRVESNTIGPKRGREGLAVADGGTFNSDHLNRGEKREKSNKSDNVVIPPLFINTETGPPGSLPTPIPTHEPNMPMFPPPPLPLPHASLLPILQPPPPPPQMNSFPNPVYPMMIFHPPIHPPNPFMSPYYNHNPVSNGNHSEEGTSNSRKAILSKQSFPPSNRRSRAASTSHSLQNEVTEDSAAKDIPPVGSKLPRDTIPVDVIPTNSGPAVTLTVMNDSSQSIGIVPNCRQGPSVDSNVKSDSKHKQNDRPMKKMQSPNKQQSSTPLVPSILTFDPSASVSLHSSSHGPLLIQPPLLPNSVVTEHHQGTPDRKTSPGRDSREPIGPAKRSRLHTRPSINEHHARILPNHLQNKTPSTGQSSDSTTTSRASSLDSRLAVGCDGEIALVEQVVKAPVAESISEQAPHVSQYKRPSSSILNSPLEPLGGNEEASEGVEGSTSSSAQLSSVRKRKKSRVLSDVHSQSTSVILLTSLPVYGISCDTVYALCNACLPAGTQVYANLVDHDGEKASTTDSLSRSTASMHTTSTHERCNHSGSCVIRVKVLLKARDTVLVELCSVQVAQILSDRMRHIIFHNKQILVDASKMTQLTVSKEQVALVSNNLSQLYDPSFLRALGQAVMRRDEASCSSDKEGVSTTGNNRPSHFETVTLTSAPMLLTAKALATYPKLENVFTKNYALHSESILHLVRTHYSAVSVAPTSSFSLVFACNFLKSSLKQLCPCKTLFSSCCQQSVEEELPIPSSPMATKEPPLGTMVTHLQQAPSCKVLLTILTVPSSVVLLARPMIHEDVSIHFNHDWERREGRSMLMAYVPEILAHCFPDTNHTMYQRVNCARVRLNEADITDDDGSGVYYLENVSGTSQSVSNPIDVPSVSTIKFSQTSSIVGKALQATADSNSNSNDADPTVSGPEDPGDSSKVLHKSSDQSTSKWDYKESTSEIFVPHWIGSLEFSNPADAVAAAARYNQRLIRLRIEPAARVGQDVSQSSCPTNFSEGKLASPRNPVLNTESHVSIQESLLRNSPQSAVGTSFNPSCSFGHYFLSVSLVY